MKKISSLTCLALLTTGLLLGDATLSGEAIMDKTKHANEPGSSETTAVLELYAANAQAPREKRSISMKSRRFPNGEKKAVFRFTDSGYRGTTFLTVEKPNADTLHYLFLNSVGRERQLAAAEKQNAFLDTDFTNEDLGGIRLSEYTFERIADMEKDGRKLLRVWCNRKDPAARFPRYLAIVDAESFVMVEARIFNKGGKLERIGRFSDIRTVAGKYRIPHRLEVEDVGKGTRSLITITDFKADTRVRDSVFQPWNMKNPW